MSIENLYFTENGLQNIFSKNNTALEETLCGLGMPGPCEL